MRTNVGGKSTTFFFFFLRLYKCDFPILNTITHRRSNRRCCVSRKKHSKCSHLAGSILMNLALDSVIVFPLPQYTPKVFCSSPKIRALGSRYEGNNRYSIIIITPAWKVNTDKLLFHFFFFVNSTRLLPRLVRVHVQCVESDSFVFYFRILSWSYRFIAFLRRIKPFN